VSTTDRFSGVTRAIDLFGASDVRGRHVLLKPNFNSADPAPGSTHPDVLRAIAASLSDSGARSTTIGDRAGMGDTRQVMHRKGVFDLAEEFGMDAVVFDELPDDAWQIVGEGTDHWSRGVPVPKLLLESDSVVQTCILKTHGYGGHFSLSLKNSVGLAAKHFGGHNYMDELHDSPDMRKMIAEVNTAYDPTLIVVDGVEALVKGGPATGTRAATGVVLAGSDRIAVDAVGVAILRLFGTTADVDRGRIFDLEQIARAVELGLGVDEPQHIQIVTDDAVGEAYASRVTQVLSSSRRS
jgi:uncharacterized protein (DUF362 family)